MSYIKYRAVMRNISGYPVHFKIDTGMHRLGFEGYEIETLCDLLERNNRYVQVSNRFFRTWWPAKPQTHDDFTLKQISNI